MPAINPWFLLTFVLALAGAGAGGFRLGMDHVKAQELAQLTAAIDARDKAQEESANISRGFQLVVAHQNDLQKSLEGRWRNALNKPAYRDCKPNADGLRLLRDEFEASNAARGLVGEMPGITAPTGVVGHGRPDAQPAGLGPRLRDLFGTARQPDSVLPEGQ